MHVYTENFAAINCLQQLNNAYSITHIIYSYVIYDNIGKKLSSNEILSVPDFFLIKKGKY